MILRFDLTLEDALAFNRYHFRLPARRRATLVIEVALFFMLAVAALSFLVRIAPPDGSEREIPRPILLACSVAIAGLLTGLFHYRLGVARNRAVERQYQQGANRAVFGPQEVAIDADSVTFRTELCESRLLWRGVREIVETESHAFLFTSPAQAHIIPKHSVIAGDPEPFIGQAIAWWNGAKEVPIAEVAD